MQDNIALTQKTKEYIISRVFRHVITGLVSILLDAMLLKSGSRVLLLLLTAQSHSPSCLQFIPNPQEEERKKGNRKNLTS
ncbi:hypothetical protein FKM82_029396 [Ascaphus truei]